MYDQISNQAEELIGDRYNKDNTKIKINVTMPNYKTSYFTIIVLMVSIVYITSSFISKNIQKIVEEENVKQINIMTTNLLTVTPINQTDRLLFVAEINRHGAKCPDTFPDLSKEVFYGSQDSQLTFAGYEMNELLGQWIGERYREILRGKYNKDELVIYTSAKQRSFFSAIAWAKGLFPKSFIKAKYEMNKNLTYHNRNSNLPPILNYKSNHTRDEVIIDIQDPHNDNIFSAWKCKVNKTSEKSFNELFINTKIYNFTQEELREAVDEITTKYPKFISEKLSGDNIYSQSFVNSMNSYISPIQYQFNNTFFNFTQKTNLFLTRALLDKWYSLRIEESQTKRIAISGFFKRMLQFYDSILNGTEIEGISNQAKFVLFSAHDGNIIDMLTNFVKPEIIKYRLEDYTEYVDFLFPPYASSFIFELFEAQTGQKYVKILYNGDYITHMTVLKYDRELDGVHFSDFRDYLISRIDPAYDGIYCLRVDQYHKHPDHLNFKEDELLTKK